MRGAVPPRGWHAPQLSASAMRSLRVFAIRPRIAQHDVRFPAAVAFRTRTSVVTALQPTPRGKALAASAGEVGQGGEAALPEIAFFNRTAELKSLATILASPPTSVLVVTGPPSCGKSVMLKQLVAGIKQSPRPSVIDCRLGDYTNPETFSENLVTCVQNDWQLDDKWLSSMFPTLAKVTGSALGAELKVEFLKAELKKDPKSALQKIKNAYLKLMKNAKQKRKAGDPWPVIIIDEANLLTGWEDQTSLNSLLSFFVYITKQEQLGHVILATSDTFLTQWLESGPIKGPFRDNFVVGNFTREEARTFFFDYVLPCFKTPLDAKEAWERVYEVCGGNPGLLPKCASKAAALCSWELGCNAIVQIATKEISNGLRLVSWPDAAWGTDDFRAVLSSIVSSPYAAVPVAQLDSVLGDGGAAKLESMNQKNLLVLRQFDPLARDIDPAAFGPDLDDVYTLPSAAHVLAARRKLNL